MKQFQQKLHQNLPQSHNDVTFVTKHGHTAYAVMNVTQTENINTAISSLKATLEDTEKEGGEDDKDDSKSNS